MLCCNPNSLATTSVASTMAPKCCVSFLKLFTCFRVGNADDGQDGDINGHDIHFKCVLACCSGTVTDNDMADRTKREECNANADEKQRKRKQRNKLSKTITRGKCIVMSKKSKDSENNRRGIKITRESG